MVQPGFTRLLALSLLCAPLAHSQGAPAKPTSSTAPAAQQAAKQVARKAARQAAKAQRTTFADKAAHDWQQFQLMFRQSVSRGSAIPAGKSISLPDALHTARKLMERQDFNAAQKVLEQQLTRRLKHEQKRQVYLELITVHLYAGKTEAARQVLTSIKRDNEQRKAEPSQRLRYLKAYYDHLTGDQRAARDELTALLSDAPQFLLGYSLLSQTYLSRGKLALAKDVLLRAIDNGLASPAIDLRLGVIAMKAGKYTEAHRLLTEVLKTQPENIVAHINLGMTLMAQKHYKAAEKSLLKARKLAPKRSFCHFALGMLYHRQHKFKKAADSYRLALQGPAPSPYLRYNYAMLLFKHQKNDPKGLQYLFEVTQLAGPSTDIYKIARALLAKAEDHRL